MGYFSQRKRKERENIFFKIMLIILGVLTIVTLFSVPESFTERIKDYLFQIYIINIFIFVYALILRRFFYVFVFLMILFVNYTQIASYANVFTNMEVLSGQKILVHYEPSKTLIIDEKDKDILNSGHFNFGSENYADFITFEKNRKIVTLINADLRNPNENHYKALADFIIKQDNPVIVIGRLGYPAWNKKVRSFLDETNLQVKNRTVLISDNSGFSLLERPVFYILGFDNSGISSIETGYNDNTSKPYVISELNFY